MQRHDEHEQGSARCHARGLPELPARAPSQAPGHALRLRRREPAVVVGCARWRRRPALPRARTPGLVRTHTASKEAVYREDRRPPACYSPLAARLPRSNALNTDTSGMNSATITRHATSPRSQPAWSAQNSSRRAGNRGGSNAT